MQTAKLKTYAPKARRDFIAAVTRRAAKLGLTAKGVSPIRDEGQLVFIEGQPYPKSVGGQRAKLAKRIAQQGFEPVMEATAYTWFNRFAAIRYMELHGYLDHSFRVLSHPGGSALPEILEHAHHLDLPGLDRARVMDLKLDGTRDEELYRDLLLAQCRALHQAMPFLFESLDDATELLLPENLLQTDSLIRELVTAIPEDNWQEIEIIGWLYQFYISEKKDQVIGKVVKSEDIPAATQLFTPNWIVQYLVQNSVGRLWLMANPASTLTSQWPYYIQPAEQTPEVQAQLNALIQTRMDEDGGSLSPESITVLDPACGSGHILVVAYDVLKAIYLERGYQARAIPRLILEENLYGLDIDDRAAQMAGFALLMKARADDRRLLDQAPKLNVLSLQESKGLDADMLAQAINAGGAELVEVAQLRWLIDTFEHAKTFGSLIQTGQKHTSNLPKLQSIVHQSMQMGDLYAQAAAQDVLPLVQQAIVLGMQFDAVVANPPYMGSGGMNGLLRAFATNSFSDAKSDIFACFMERAYTLTKSTGYSAMVTMLGWMFLSSFQNMRERLLREKSIVTMAQIGYNSFPSMNSKIAQATAFSIFNRHVEGMSGVYIDLNGASQSANKEEVFLTQPAEDRFKVIGDDFSKFPSSTIAFWVPRFVMDIFASSPALGDIYSAKSGVMTGDDEFFLKYWYELDFSSIGFNCTSEKETLASQKFFPMNKEEGFRKWSGRYTTVLRYVNHGAEHAARDDINYRLREKGLYFKEGISWGDVTSGPISFRYQRSGLIFAARAPTIFSNDKVLLAFLNSKVANYFCGLINPTLSFNLIDLYQLPFLKADFNSFHPEIEKSVDALVKLSEGDWDVYERSWDFQSFPFLAVEAEPASLLEVTYSAWSTMNRETITEMQRIEGENNRLFINAYGLQDELTPDVPIEQITLTVNPAYRYGKKLADDDWSVEHGFGEELETRFREDTMQELVSYAIGCMMGRYRLDRPGLVYAHSGNERFWEIYEGGMRDEGRGVSKELSGSHRLAEIDGAGRASLPDDQDLSGGGTLRSEQSNSASSSFDTIEHRGGSCTPDQGGVSELPFDRPGVEGRSGNADVDRHQAGLRYESASRNDSLATDGAIEDAQCAAKQTRPSSLTPNPFPPDEDGILPITDTDWFDDDAAHRLVEFIAVAWGEVESGELRVESEDGERDRRKIDASENTPLTTHHSSLTTHLEENLSFLANNLSPKKGESSRDTIRRYLSDRFFKNHLQTYKNRPIYWCFSSGKQKAFQCLVYLHRYHEGTLARMRMEYVVPLQSKMAARIDKLSDDIQSASTSAQAKRLQKERDKLVKQLDELRRFDEQLRHYADQRIALDLDDGVKVNYGKFGNLLAEVKTVTGQKSD
ncbi:hypothetical protein CKO25_18375 [Thiocapsa imhoffii]|uniref:site-specific DNA-methyltransferase (adenine-specific) n=1 Tax=Thiocapsa imhoffii TaxID=382777 RepID=A0A9X0WL31_9GAMM|nr:hypothetical protein [Thiocapsa imhoffii]